MRMSSKRIRYKVRRNDCYADFDWDFEGDRTYIDAVKRMVALRYGRIEYWGPWMEDYDGDDRYAVYRCEIAGSNEPPLIVRVVRKDLES